MAMLTCGRWGASLAIALALVVAAPGLAAPKTTIDPSAPSFVDIGRVFAEYRKSSAFGKYQLRIKEQSKKFAEEMELLVKLRHCTDAERQEGLMLKAKPKLEKKEQARFDELLKVSDAVDNELATLGQKEKPSDDDAKRIAELSKKRQDALKLLAKEENDRRDKMRDLETDLYGEVETELLKIIEKLAKDRKLGVIYERRSVLVGGNDLTNEIIGKLPK